MSWARVFTARVAGLLCRPCRADDELDEEVRFHLDMQIDENLARGMSPTDARRAALRSFGGVGLMKERYREGCTFAFLESIALDVRHTGRALRRNPAFAITAAATLAVAMGAVTAMFSVIDAVLVRPLPYPSPEQLALVWTGAPSQPAHGRWGYRTIQEWQARTNSFSTVAVFDPASATIAEAEGTGRIAVARVSPAFFALLGTQPSRGRLFSDREAAERQPVALIDDGYWRTHFGGSSDAIGQFLVLDGRRTQIIGVLPSLEGFATEIWEPHTLVADWNERQGTRGGGSWFILGRMRPDVTIDHAQSDANDVALALDREARSDERTQGATVMPLDHYLVGTRTRLALWLLSLAVVCVLVIAAANVASLSLARAVGRSREFTVRLAIGASPWRVARQLLVESMVLTIVSAAGGVMLARAGIAWLQSDGLNDLPRLTSATLDGRALLLALGIAFAVGVLIGCAPAWTMLADGLHRSVRPGGHGVSNGTSAHRIRRTLVVLEFALAIALTCAAGLLLRSWSRLDRVHLGFRPERLLTFQLAVPPTLAAEGRAPFFARVLDEIHALPGVESAGTIGDLFVGNAGEPLLTLEGDTVRSMRVRMRLDEVSERLFTTLGTPLLEGRFFTSADGPDAPHVAIVNGTMARRLWPNGSAVGRRFKFGPPDANRPWFTVVGIVEDMRREGLEADPIPQMFQPLAQDPSRLETVVVRTSVDDPLTIVKGVEAAAGRIDKLVAIYGAGTVDGRLARFLAPRRLQTTLVTAFSAAALLLAAIGIYGLIHYSVTARTQEIGIRMAIGASGADIVRLIVRELAALCGVGFAIGLAAAIAVGRLGSSLLYGVTATDPLTFSAVTLLLMAVAAFACVFPARRAASVDPTIALRI